MSRNRVNMLDENTAVLAVDRKLCERYVAGTMTEADKPELEKLIGSLCMALRDMSGTKSH